LVSLNPSASNVIKNIVILPDPRDLTTVFGAMAMSHFNGPPGYPSSVWQLAAQVTPPDFGTFIIHRPA
jgi:hypothetical protein